MRTIAGIFNTQADAERSFAELRARGIAEERLSLLVPGATAASLDAVPTTETEQPGMGTALGSVVGGALGVASGLPLGAAAASLFVPGVGPILAAGIIGAALFGAGGAAAGAAAGGAMEDTVAGGLPADELYVYEDALRQGRSVVIAVTEDEQAESTRQALEQSGAESLDAARENWWIGLRDAEEATYGGEGRDFRKDEPVFRQGFEAALHPSARGKSYETDAARLRSCFGGVCDQEAFRQGYERGRKHYQALTESYKS